MTEFKDHSQILCKCGHARIDHHRGTWPDIYVDSKCQAIGCQCQYFDFARAGQTTTGKDVFVLDITPVFEIPWGYRDMEFRLEGREVKLTDHQVSEIRRRAANKLIELHMDEYNKIIEKFSTCDLNEIRAKLSESMPLICSIPAPQKSDPTEKEN